MPETVEIPYRILYKMTTIAGLLKMGNDEVRRALITGQLEGRMTEKGRYFVMHRGLQAWVDRGRPLFQGDGELREDLVVNVLDREPAVRFSYRLAEAARLVSVSPAYLSTQAYLGYLRAKKAGGIFLIPRPSLLAWVEQLYDVEYRPKYGWLPPYRGGYQVARLDPFRRRQWD